MATLRELKNRLRGVRATCQLTGAMKTVAAAKYSAIHAKRLAFTPYAEACARMSAAPGAEAPLPEGAADKPMLYVLFSSERGLCGGYDAELFEYFRSLLQADGAPPARILACGRKGAEYCLDKKLGTPERVPLSAVPAYDEARALGERLKALFDGGEVSEIRFVYQRFINMLRREPCQRRFLPLPEAAGPEGDRLLLPDGESVRRWLERSALETELYAHLLDCAAGVQAATLTAMRAAYDNAVQTARALETAISRRRQAEITAGVIETAAGDPD